MAMKRHVLVGFVAALLCSGPALAQPLLPPGASPQAAQDPGYQALIASCKVAPPAAPVRAAPPPPTSFPPPEAKYEVTAIPGVIASGQTWTKVWETSGNNADGILADKDGNILIAQNHNSAVVKLDYKSNKVTTVYKDTHTGGALSMNSKGELFVVERGLHANVTQLTPRRAILADKLPNGDPLDCIGGVINDLSADSKGGAYFTMGGLFYASPNGVVTRYGQDLSTNGVILSADEKTVYVTDGVFGTPGRIVAFDVQRDGSLMNQREFFKIPSAGGDGLTIDAQNNLYITAGRNVYVVASDGRLLGTIPAPYSLISAAFGGRDKKTLYAVVSLSDPTRLQHAFVYSIPMLAQGYKGRAK
jgi:gluconolactonase